MDEETEKINYWPFAIVTFVSVCIFSFSDLYLLGVLPLNEWYGNVYYLPMLNLFLMAAVVYYSLKLEFETRVILVLALLVLLFAPSLFIVIVALGGTYNPYALIQFYSSMQ